MSASIVRHLIRKDLFLLRPMMIGALALGAVAIALMPLGETQFFVGWLILFIALVLLGIFTTVVGVTTERKDRVHLFVLTLPTTPAQYTAAKLAANAIAFLVPWAILLGAALTLVAVTGIPDTLMPFLAMLLGYAVCYYAAYLGMSLVTDSVVLSTLVIIAGNTAPVFLIPAFIRMTGAGADPVPGEPIWTAGVLTVLACELAFSAGSVGLAVFARSRRRDSI